jgi:hypothetical protein
MFALTGGSVVKIKHNRSKPVVAEKTIKLKRMINITPAVDFERR